MFTVGLDVDRVSGLCSQKIELYCWESLRDFRSTRKIGNDRENPKIEEKSAGNFRSRGRLDLGSEERTLNKQSMLTGYFARKCINTFSGSEETKLNKQSLLTGDYARKGTFSGSKYKFTGSTMGNLALLPKGGSPLKKYYKWDELPKVSDHMSKRKELTKEEFGDYLAGLIDGDGWIGERQIEIIFNELDTFLAYKIKKRIGYGNVYKIRGKKAVSYRISKKEGLRKVIELINGRLRKRTKVLQLEKNIIITHEGLKRILPVKENKDFNNYWLTGFADADGCFHIGVERSKSHKVGRSLRLEFSLKQKALNKHSLFTGYYARETELLNKVKEYFKGGNESEYKTQDVGSEVTRKCINTFSRCYKSTGSITAYRVIRYFEEYKLESSKYIKFIKYRNVYRMMTRGEHLTEEGIKKIERIRSKGSSETKCSSN